MNDTTIDEHTVRRLATLCALRLDPDETAQLARELSAIVRHIDLLMTVDVDGVPPTTQVLGNRRHARSDTPRPSLSQAQALDPAPHTQGSGFTVPSYIDEG